MELAETMPDVLSLGRGDPDMHTPAAIVEAGVRAFEHPVAPSPVRGVSRLRSALAERYAREKGLHFDPDREILITNGAQEGLFLTMLALVNPADEVLVPDPRYSSYDQAIEAAGGRLIELPTSADDDFQLKAETLERHAGGAKLLILVNPSNPTGSLVPPEEVEGIATVARRRNLLMISDEIYENLVFDGGRAQSVAACDGMRESTVTLSGFSKTYAMTGFRVGYLAGPPAFIEAATQIKAAVSGPCPLLSQHVALAALEGSQATVADLHAVFARRRRLMLDGLTALGIPYGTPGGGFYVWADISQFGMPASAFCRRLLIDHRVLIFPGSSFGAKWSGYVRISLLQTEERLTEALDRLAQFISTLRTEVVA
jgi:aspartate/methionine/tyrosine aminotransferase